MLMNVNKRRCAAVTNAGEPCGAWALSGQGRAPRSDFCIMHAPREARGRVCTARRNDGAACRAWAMTNDPPLCKAHVSAVRRQAQVGSGGEQLKALVRKLDREVADRRCTALAEKGRRCAAWPVRGKSLCSKHSRPQEEAARRCTARTKEGRQCRKWSMRGSEALHGRRLCATHAPGPAAWRPRPQRRCQARTVGGARCQRAAVRRGRLCWVHLFPDRHPRITHGFTRKLPYFPAAVSEQIRALAADEPLAAEIYVLRLKLADLEAYLQRPELTAKEKENAASALFTAARSVMKLTEALEALKGGAAAGLAPRIWGGIRQQVQAVVAAPAWEEAEDGRDAK